MQRLGMCFGSHTHTHTILTKLSAAQQDEELRTSRAILERELGCTVDTLAYPRGKPETFSEDTFAALRNNGYSTAFSFYNGINRAGQMQAFNVTRCAVDGESPSLFRLRMAGRAVIGRELL